MSCLATLIGRKLACPEKRRQKASSGFFHDRLKVYLRDEGIRHDVIDACLELDGGDDLALIVARARALQEVLAPRMARTWCRVSSGPTTS